jgi:hypothetical protein
MKIELKNVKHSEFASHETNCFEASVYIDGVRAGIVENGGYGACNNYHPHELERTLSAYAKTLPHVVTDMRDPLDSSKIFTYEKNADHVINELLTEHLYAKDLKRALAKKILYVAKDDGLIYETKTLTKLQMQIYLAKANIEDVFKSKTILNTLPFSEALSIYRRGAHV